MGIILSRCWRYHVTLTQRKTMTRCDRGRGDSNDGTCRDILCSKGGSSGRARVHGPWDKHVTSTQRTSRVLQPLTLLAFLEVHVHFIYLYRGRCSTTLVNYRGRGARIGLGPEFLSSSPSLYLHFFESTCSLPSFLRGLVFHDPCKLQGSSGHNRLGA